MRYQYWAVCMIVGATAGLTQEVTWDFEEPQVTWRPRTADIALTREKGPGPTADGTAYLRVTGQARIGYNYVLSPTLPMQGGRLYRLSAWVRVDKLGEGTQPPFLKCEFLADGKSTSLGRSNTESYDAPLGRWQKLTGEFMAPEDTTHFWVALEKGSSAPMQIDASLDDVKVEPIDELSVLKQFELAPLPAELEQTRGVHPRLYLNPRKVAELRRAIHGTHAALWQEVRTQADKAVESGPPAYRGDDGWSGNEQLWQRSVGNIMPAIAMAYVLTEDAKYLQSARDWALASCGYSTWGLGSTDGMDLATGHQLFGLAIVYDWCYENLRDDEKRTMRDTLIRRTDAMFTAAATGKAWWRRSYLQNHLWVNICGMAAAGFALFDEAPEATRWIGLPLDKFRRTMEALGDDGASHEGVGYWQYGAEYMLKFMHLARELLGVDMYDHPWWRQTADYWQYMALPRGAWTRSNVVVDIADCPRGNWYGPDYILRALAGEYQDPYAQWSAQQVDEANVDSACARWLNLIWYDSSLTPMHPADRPTLRHFPDMDIVSSRSGWSGDEALVVLKCGPYIGHKAVEQFSYDPGGGHVHPDANHFVVFGAGQWLIRDDGYQAKWTGQHNTLLVDGRGQVGEGKQWFDGAAALAARARPHILLASSTRFMDHIAGDATQAYPAALGLKRYVRHLLFLKPHALIVIDDVRVDAPKRLELRFHPEHQEGEQFGPAYLFAGRKATVRLEPLTTEGVQAELGAITGEGRHGAGEFSMLTVTLAKTTDSWRNATAISWASAGHEPPAVTLRRADEDWVFEVDGQTVLFRWDTVRAELQ